MAHFKVPNSYFYIFAALPHCFNQGVYFFVILSIEFEVVYEKQVGNFRSILF